MPGKNLVLFFDGTGDWAPSDDTNVFRLFKKLDCQTQKLFYDGGVGTLSSAGAISTLKRTWLKLCDLAFATGLGDKVSNGYAFLVQNYEPGDKIYLFGFSRGAFTARVLAAMVYKFGILRPEHQNLIPYLWQAISSIGQTKVSFNQFLKSGHVIKEGFTNHADIKIDFMGLFDTVSSVGVLKQFKTFPYTERNPILKKVRHAVSISEERNAFPEMLFQLRPDDPDYENCDIVEVWFPGVHRDVGGGYIKNNGLPIQVLEWMVSEAEGLQYRSGKAPKFRHKDKRVQLGTNPYVVLGLMPMKMWDPKVNAFRRFWPNLIHVRQIPANGLVHPSVKDLQADPKSLFCPVNLPREPNLYESSKAANVPKIYETKKSGFDASDAAGIILGIAFTSLLSFRITQGNFGVSAPSYCGLELTGLALIYWVASAFWQRLSPLIPKGFRQANVVWSFLGLVVAGLLIFANQGWAALDGSLGLGAIVAASAQFGKWPSLRTDRTLPFFALNWLSFSILLWVFQWIDRHYDPEYVLSNDQSGLIALLGVTAIYGFYKVISDRLLMGQVQAAADQGKTYGRKDKAVPADDTSAEHPEEPA